MLFNAQLCKNMFPSQYTENSPSQTTQKIVREVSG